MNGGSASSWFVYEPSRGLALAVAQRPLQARQRLVRRRRQVAGEEARALPRVAGGTGGFDEGEHGVVVAVDAQGLDGLRVAGRRALVPQLVARAAEEVQLARLAGQAQRFFVHVGEGQDLAGAPILDDARDEAPVIEAQLWTGRLHFGACSLGASRSAQGERRPAERSEPTSGRRFQSRERAAVRGGARPTGSRTRRARRRCPARRSRGRAWVIIPASRCEPAQVRKTPLIATPDSDQPPSSGRRAIWVRAVKSADERVVGEQEQVRDQRAQVDAVGVWRGAGPPTGSRRRRRPSGPAGPAATAACGRSGGRRGRRTRPRRAGAMKITAGASPSASAATCGPCGGLAARSGAGRRATRWCGPQVSGHHQEGDAEVAEAARAVADQLVGGDRRPAPCRRGR